MKRSVSLFLLVLGPVLLLEPGAWGSDETTEPVPATIGFNRDVRPIVAENCLACHGPDKNKRKGDLRLDVRDGGAFDSHDGKTPIVAGNPAASDLIARISSSDPREKMPPITSKKKLTARQVEVLRKWIQQGAAYQPLWSFIPPQRPAEPAVKDIKWVRNAIDRFILAGLEKQNFKPGAEADRTTLIRRATLDLLGLPPTPVEVEAFVSDNAPDAFEKVVDRLLANPHFGERMALEWLDAARYADTHGYHIDSGRDMTRWREWVIEAYNHNMPFDQFTVEQLSGDLLPGATDDQKIASGFNRNNMVNFEGGAIPEEYETAYCIDRVNTTGTVWLGLTVGCAQCHDHKFDPLTQKDFYRLFAFFHNVPENGLDGSKGNAVPFLMTPTAEQRQRLDGLTKTIAEAEARLAGPNPDADADEAQWEHRLHEHASVEWKTLSFSSLKSAGGATLAVEPDGSVRVTGANPAQDTYTLSAPLPAEKVTAIRLEALPLAGLAGGGPGRSINGNVVLTSVSLSAGAGDDLKPLKIRSASADFSQKDFPVGNAIDSDPASGWALFPEVGKPHFAVFELEAPIQKPGARLTATLDFHSPFSQHALGHLRLSTTSAADPRPTAKLPPDIGAIVAIDPSARKAAQQAALRDYFRHEVWPTGIEQESRLASLRKEKSEIESKAPSTMIMAELPHPRDTFVLMRGQYDKPGERVTSGIPAVFGSLPPDAPRNRLGLARWIVSPSNPLTARVTVNRLWQMFFGAGLVKTAEDFGSQGENPSHPELLDWLAVQFMHPADPAIHPWDVKAMVRAIVTSSTYRQSSAVSPELLELDPENRQLARGPRFRLPAELVRDQALAVSGLLNPRIGGPSVLPYQPAGLWEELMSRGDGANWTAQVYVQSHGPDLYRRSMYTFWKRTSPPPTMATFDAPDREVCTVRRARTNTPLQALVLMNDPTYIESSRKLAERLMTEGGPSPADRIAVAFRLVLARAPRPRETQVLQRLYQRQIAMYQKDPAAAAKLLEIGESSRNPALQVPDLAAWTFISSVMLNLDETVTKE